MISVVPFGYGEITLKDFESFMNGCILAKPSLNHMDTWPDFYIEDKTYIPFSWDLLDIIEKIEMIKIIIINIWISLLTVKKFIESLQQEKMQQIYLWNNFKS